MKVRSRIEELLRQRQDGVVERWKARVFGDRGPNPKTSSLLDHLPGLVQAMADAIGQGDESCDEALKLHTPPHSPPRAERAKRAGDVTVEFIHLRAALYDELHDGLPDMTAEEWWIVDRAIDNAVADVIHRSDAAREERLLAMQETVRLQDRFTSMLGHDLRSSLNGISGFAQLLQRDTQDPQQLRPAQRIVAIVGRMDRLIGDMLDLARARSGLGLTLSLERIDLAALCRTAIDMSAHANKGRVRFSDTLRERIDGDAQRMSQVIVNILAHAMAEASETSVIDMTTSASGPDAVLTLRYSGRPLTAEILAEIFDPFRSHGRSTHLGLCVARELAIAHGGDIDADSTEVGNTTFNVRIPRTAVEGTPSDPSRTRKP